MLRIVKIVAIAALFLTGGLAQATETLDRLKGDKRPLLLFSKSRSDAGLGKQIDLLRDFRPEMRARSVIVLHTSGNEETRAAIGYTSIDRGTARALRQRFAPEPRGLTVILVGKDGTEKARWQRIVSPDEIFKTIDAMPMRQREMQESGATN